VFWVEIALQMDMEKVRVWRKNANGLTVKPVNPVKPVKPIRAADWLTGLTTLTGYFEVPFSTGGTSQRCIMSSTSCRSMTFIVNHPKRNQITG
jgi:hypothetical protein